MSHTGEAAFSNITNINSSEIRKMIISGSKKLPEEYNLSPILNKLGLSTNILLSLFNKKFQSFKDQDLNYFWHIIHSSLTPDTLDGVWRAGKNLGISHIPKPPEIVQSFSNDMLDVLIKINYWELIKKFWVKKMDLYENYINDKFIVQWESTCSSSILEDFKNLSLIESLEIPEDILINHIKANTSIKSKITLEKANLTLRYKEPLLYKINSINKRFDQIPIDHINKILTKHRG